MKPKRLPELLGLAAACALICGCASTHESDSASAGTATASAGPNGTIPWRYRADDGRTIEIGKSSPADGGLTFKDPHLEKCWVAADFKFTGYDVLYIAPTLSTAKFHDDEARPHELAKASFPVELKRMLDDKKLFPAVVLQESEIKPGAKVLKLENTITEYSKGGGGARYFVGLYGGGQPVLRVNGKMTDGDRSVFVFEGRRSGVSAGARLTGAFMKDEDIQIEDIRSLALDLSDFMAAVAGRYQPR